MPEKQVEKVDVLLTVNDKYKIIIEDKTYTAEHDNQLSRYREAINKKYPDHTVVGVYYKIGFQSDKRIITESGYKYFGLDEIYIIIEKHINRIGNDIFIDYYNYIKCIRDEIAKYKTLPVCKWNWAQINGFFDYIKSKSYGDMYYDYGYVPNQTGGFEGMWIYNSIYGTYKDTKYELYLQCEFVDQRLNICYKASSKDNLKIDSSARENFIWKNENGEWVDNAALFGFTKPKRYGYGKTVTIGFYKVDESITGYLSAEKKINEAIDDFKRMIKKMGIN